MELYFINSQEFLSKIDKIDKRTSEYKLGRFLVNYVLKTFYNIEDEIIIKNKKPYLKDNGIFFSLSHSNGIIAAAFDKYEIGFDVEFVKKRNFEEILKRLKAPFQEPSSDFFYSYWTQYEAEYKLQQKAKFKLTFDLLGEYKATIASNSISGEVRVYELKKINNSLLERQEVLRLPFS